MKISVWKALLAVLITFAAGFVLKYFELSTYLILIGFRFHIGAVLPFFFISGTTLLPYIKKEFTAPPFNRIFIFLLMILAPLVIGCGVLFGLKLIDIGDPEYFYELGISSVFDFPIYLLWNMPQLIMLYFFLLSLAETFKIKFVPLFITVLLLFGYEFIPLNKPIVNYPAIGAFIGLAVIASLLIRFYKNVYWFCITLFTLLWSIVFLAGSSSKVMINNLFASQYRFWEGMLDINKSIGDYFIDGIILFALLIAIAGLLLKPKKEKEEVLL